MSKTYEHVPAANNSTRTSKGSGDLSPHTAQNCAVSEKPNGCVNTGADGMQYNKRLLTFMRQLDTMILWFRDYGAKHADNPINGEVAENSANELVDCLCLASGITSSLAGYEFERYALTSKTELP